MAPDDPLRLTDGEKRHQEVMRGVVARMQDTPYVLKGGTAILLTRDLPRHSTDLDFDSGRKLNIEGRIRDGLRDAGVEVRALTVAKDTDTVQRFKVHYAEPGAEGRSFLKIETSFRDEPDPAAVEVASGIRTYKVERIYDQKLDASENRAAPRDLYDLAHLTERYGDRLSDAQIARADRMTRDLDGLVNRYATAFERDPVLSRTQSVDDTVIGFRVAVEDELGRRALERENAERIKERDATLYVVAGPNGSGKSTLTAAGRFGHAPVIDPDAIARQIAPDAPETAAVQAGRVAVAQRRDAIAQRESFVVETTLAGNATFALMREARENGYRVELHYVRAESADQTVDRVANRVARGGHDVPEDDIRRRFDRSVANLPRAISEADRADLYDNAEADRAHRRVAELTPDRYRIDRDAPAWAKEAAAFAAQRDHGRATTEAEMDRAFQRYREVGRSDGIELERGRGTGRERGRGRDVSRDDGFGL